MMQTPHHSINHHQQQATLAVQFNNQLYDRIRCLGRGSFGTAVVYRRRADCSLVVLKEIDLLNFRGEREKCSVINEARIMSKLNHNNIIKYFNAYTTETKLIIEMEYASLGTLATYLSLQVQPLNEQEVLIIFRQIACGLDYLHSKKIIHLDLKMANIFVTAEGLIKIGDFGIAQYISNGQTGISSTYFNQRKHIQRVSSHLGTLAYSSPEHCLGEATSYKSDIWSLGCILYELITRRPLFSSNNLSDLLISITHIHFRPFTENISTSLKYIFELMIAREPEKRPDANELLNMIDQLLSQMETLKRDLQVKSPTQRFDLSSGVALLAAQNQDNLEQISYLHSLVYQIRLDTQHIHVERVHLPNSKRIKEVCKGKSHFLVLTYDNIVYGWGYKSHGQLGACGLNASGVISRDRSACSSIDSRLANHYMVFSQKSSSQTISAASSLASSTQTIIPNQKRLNVSTSCQQMTKELIMNELNHSKPVTRPIVINELNNRRIIQVAAGKNFSIFLSKTGIVMTCGDGSAGCLGRGTFKSNYTPKMVESLLNKDVVYIACGPQHVVAVCGNGQAFSWGRNKNGRLGIGGGVSESVSRSSNLTSYRKLSQKVHLENEKSSEYILYPRPVLLSSQVHIKSVFCGDNCTVFIDSHNRCWACGENRFNRLGLDVKRKWKSKAMIIERNFIPQQIKPLRKYRIVSCSIGRNHTSFVTQDGKLIVIGRDIDYSNKFKTSSDLSGISKNICRSNPHLLNSINSTNRLRFSQTNSENVSQKASNLSLPVKVRRHSNIFLKLGRVGRKLHESHLKKSRMMRKMPLENVIRVACTSKFTLALTNNNQIYFSGTRSYKHLEEGSTVGQSETQSIHNANEDCFVKIGTTNSSLMKNIQALGCDQPIIHAQDPKLIARTLSDLWILDYKLDNDHCSNLRTSDCSISSSSTSYCSLCSLCNSTLNNSLDSSRSSINSDSSVSNTQGTTRYDAILQPQPIISLYVPSMFNQSRNSLQIVDLFCHQKNSFYLVLDTTVNLQQCQSRPASTQPHTSSLCDQRTQPFVEPHHKDSRYDSSYRNDRKDTDTLLNQELASKLNNLPKIEASDCSAPRDTSNNQFHPDVDLTSGMSCEEPRSFSTLASSLDNHIIINRPLVYSSNVGPMMPLVFGEPETSKIMDDDDDDDKTPQNSASKSEVSNTIAETSSMPSWVKNEFIECQLNNTYDGHDLYYEELSIDPHEESMCIERPPIFMGDALELDEVNLDGTSSKHSYTTAPDTASITSDQTMRKELCRSHRFNYSLNETKTSFSRSQSDICHTSSNHNLASDVIAQRRASILTERSDQNAANLLQCEVYKNRIIRDKYLTTEFKSSSDLQFNSGSQMNCMLPLNERGSFIPNEAQKLTSSALPRINIESIDNIYGEKMNIHKTGEQMIWSSWSSRLSMVGGKGLRKGGSYKLETGKDKTNYSSSTYSVRRSFLKLFC